MQCLYCISSDTKVTDSVKTGKKILRERTCQSCHKRFYTEGTRSITEQTAIRNQLRITRAINVKKERNSAKGYLDGSNARQV